MTHDGQNRAVQLEKLNILLTPSEEGETSPSKQRRSSRGESNSTFTVHPLTWYIGGDVMMMMIMVGPTSLMISFPDEMSDVPVVPALPDLGADKRWLGTE